MDMNEYVALELGSTKRGLIRVLDSLNQQELSWRPTCGCNSIGLIIFHMVRSEDSFVQSRLQGKPETWLDGKWYEKLNKAETDTGAHYTADQVNSFQVPEKQDILAYFDAVRTKTQDYLRGLSPDAFDRKFQTPRFGEISVAFMFSLIVGHLQQHIGEISYLRGLQRGVDK